jgi:hypothetical protein
LNIRKALNKKYHGANIVLEKLGERETMHLIQIEADTEEERKEASIYVHGILVRVSKLPLRQV